VRELLSYYLSLEEYYMEETITKVGSTAALSFHSSRRYLCASLCVGGQVRVCCLLSCRALL
jgi:hypothetical protein